MKADNFSVDPLSSESTILGVSEKELPAWLFYTEDLYTLHLSDLLVSDLASVAKHCFQSSNEGTIPEKKSCYISIIVSHFLANRSNMISSSLSNGVSYHALTEVIEKTYGAIVAALLCEPPFVLAPFINRTLNVSILFWCNESVDELVHCLQKISKKKLLENIKKIPIHRRPIVDRASHRKTSNALVDHILRRVSYLFSLSLSELCDIALSVSYSEFEKKMSKELLIECVINYEYGDVLLQAISCHPLSRSERSKLERKHNKLSDIQYKKQNLDDYAAAWPSQVPQSHIWKCLDAYRQGTIWVDPPVCAVCGQGSENIKEVQVGQNTKDSLSLEVLRLTDDFIIRNCVIKCNSAKFTYGNILLDGLMLDKQGIHECNTYDAKLNICSECYITLTHNKMPRLALANNLYRGTLPDQFQDLTWVEEMVCSIYRNTAHITRLYGSSDPSQPTILHGNTCAHEMNVISTASVLPRTPSDINGMLSVVFVGAGKLNAESLHKMFRVRKKKVQEFLCWLKHHNHLYTNVPLDSDIINLYPEDGTLPGIENHIIQDDETNPEHAFSDHHAQLFKSEINSESNLNIETNNDAVLLDKTGIVDPECDRLSGRSFTASALKNLAGNLHCAEINDQNKNNPDLVLHHASAAISEYNNPDLMPGMFPTLFPFGIGGLKIKLV